MEEIAQIIELPDDRFFLFIDGRKKRVMIATDDIRHIIFPVGDDLKLTIATFDETFVFEGKDASLIEEYLLARQTLRAG